MRGIFLKVRHFVLGQKNDKSIINQFLQSVNYRIGFSGSQIIFLVGYPCDLNIFQKPGSYGEPLWPFFGPESLGSTKIAAICITYAYRR